MVPINLNPWQIHSLRHGYHVTTGPMYMVARQQNVQLNLDYRDMLRVIRIIPSFETPTQRELRYAAMCLYNAYRVHIFIDHLQRSHTDGCLDRYIRWAYQKSHRKVIIHVLCTTRRDTANITLIRNALKENPYWKFQYHYAGNAESNVNFLYDDGTSCAFSLNPGRRTYFSVGWSSGRIIGWEFVPEAKEDGHHDGE